MTVLKDIRKEEELVLPVTGGKVWLYSYMLAGDSIEIDQIYLKETDLSVTPGQNTSQKLSIRAEKYYEAQDRTLEAMISRWDFTDESQKPLELTLENMKKLPKQDYDYLIAQVEKRVGSGVITEVQKKN